MTSNGLTGAQAAQLLQEHGSNVLQEARGPSVPKILLNQFKGAMVWLLLGATVISAVLGERADAIAIAVVLLLNATIGFFQELRAEKAIAALKKMTAPHARVVRDGNVIDVAAQDVVPGDVLALEAGDVVAADARIVSASRLQTNEAALTGESAAVDKRAQVDDEPATTPLAERTGSVFAGTAVASGTARALVMATGMGTELGKIARLLGETKDEVTPLQRRLEGVGRTLLVLCLLVVAVVAGVALWRGMPWLEVLMTSVSLAVAAVPEGLAAIVTIALAIGVQRMAQQNVLIRHLPAVETLGCATVVCTDKTGTLTTGVMAVREVWGADRRRVLASAAACCDAQLGQTTEAAIGDPTELAVLVEALKLGVDATDIEQKNPRTESFPFDSERKRMSVMRADGVLYVKGAIDLLLPLCTSGTAGAAEANAEMAERGLRVLGVAVGQSKDEEALELLGLIGLADPPRTEAIAAVKAARNAGVRTVMITGDHPATARAIALEMGVLLPGEAIDGVVHARATPQDKIEIVKRHKAAGMVVAMTGDGVNDAPALKEAHIGIAMGKTGTEVTRAAADMVLVDDNFASIVAAIKEGRGVFDNIQKALVYLLAGNVAELTIMLVAMLIGWPLPLTALQILWVNLVTDGLPALALVADPTSPNALSRAPRKPDAPMLGASEWRRIAITGAMVAVTVLAVMGWALQRHDAHEARSLVFFTLVSAQLALAFAARSPHRTFFQVGALQNLWLLAVVGVTLLLQLALHHVPITQKLLDATALTPETFVVAAVAALVPVTVIEVAKLVRSRLTGLPRVS